MSSPGTVARYRNRGDAKEDKGKGESEGEGAIVCHQPVLLGSGRSSTLRRALFREPPVTQLFTTWKRLTHQEKVLLSPQSSSIHTTELSTVSLAPNLISGLRFTMRPLGCILLLTGMAVAATNHTEGFASQANRSMGPLSVLSASEAAAAAADNDYTCTRNKKCSLGCCGPL